MENLNERQREAVLAPDGPMLILAGAGSGKTTVLIQRVAELIARGVPPWGILAITFTNKAAGELKTRLERQLGTVGLEVWASTFHSACVRILRSDIDRLGYARGFTIYDTDDSLRLMKELVRENRVDEKLYAPKLVLGQISRAKDALLDPAQYARVHADDYRADTIAKLYAAYRRRMKESNALDFDDLIAFAVTLLLEHADVRERYQRRLRHVLVDEYQDTNHLQYLLASTLAGGYGNLTVVGDDDQSIYRFRGATIENILGFEEQYPHAKVIRLEQNYRSSGNILDAANALIARNEGRKGKNLWTDAGLGEPVALFQGYSDSDEAQYIAETALRGRGNGRKFSDYAVLYRMNAQSNRVEEAFKRSGVPYRMVGGLRFYDRMEVKDMLAYLQICRNPGDDLRLRRVLGISKGIGAKTVETAAALADRDGRSLFGVLSRAEDYPELGRSSKALAAFTESVQGFQDALAGMELDEFYDLLLDRTGYLAALKAKNDLESLGRMENVQELKSNLAQYAADCRAAGETPTLEGFLDGVSLLTDIDRFDESADAVVLMTIHAAKGLEFPEVFLIGLEEGIFPGLRSLGDPTELEEERRLCYVAVTRARERLHLTCARERLLFGQTVHNPISRFVQEAGVRIPEHPSRVAADLADARPRLPRRRAPVVQAPSAFAPPAQSTRKFTLGQRVRHKAFGEGTVVTITAMGGDALLEVAFDTAGTKRLMQKQAANFME
jgi:DNA helicase-2/ATP-dependent DNA helicase PcrA